MKKILVLVMVFTLTLYAVNTFLPVHGEAKIYDSVLRLHVIANSDSPEDQRIKLCVRDAVLESLESMLDGCADRESACERIESGIDVILAAAQSTLEDCGVSYGCSVLITDERYPTKNYEGVCFPAGKYRSLQIRLGDSCGENWWCVLFPQLCLSGAQDAQSAFVEVGLTPEQYKIITQSDDVRYKVRFKLLELVESALDGN